MHVKSAVITNLFKRKPWLTVSWLLVLALIACEADNRKEWRTGADAGTKEGLATADFLGHCSSCHQLPEPSDLPYAIWDTVILPRMAHFLGRFAPGEREALLNVDPAGRSKLLEANVYPHSPQCSEDEWAAIRSYYLRQAPQTLLPPVLPDTTLTRQFVARFPKVFLSPPSGSFIQINPNGGLSLADINKEKLLLFDPLLELKAELRVGPGLTNIAGNFATVIGSFSPTDAGTGKLVGVTPTQSTTLAGGLQRPTSVVSLNVDEDTPPELIITEYGKWTGRLSLWNYNKDGINDTTLVNRPGAITAVTDPAAGIPTLYILYGQGREEIVRYQFTPAGMQVKSIVSFPPSYGSSSLQMIDWNKDSLPDFLYTNGDNADYRSPIKPYHGIRVFTGSASGEFSEALFLPLPGAYDAKAGDFDEDGDIDIAGISFFPDYRLKKPASAVLFRNDAAAGFTSFRLPAETKGRFLRLSAGDYDLDGDIDLAAASLAMEAVPDNGRMEGWIRNGLPFVVWENTLK